MVATMMSSESKCSHTDFSATNLLWVLLDTTHPSLLENADEFLRPTTNLYFIGQEVVQRGGEAWTRAE